MKYLNVQRHSLLFGEKTDDFCVSDGIILEGNFQRFYVAIAFHMQPLSAFVHSDVIHHKKSYSNLVEKLHIKIAITLALITSDHMHYMHIGMMVASHQNRYNVCIKWLYWQRGVHEKQYALEIEQFMPFAALQVCVCVRVCE